MKTVLVTGGCGFIMSNFARFLLGHGYRVINLDALTYAGRIENTAGMQTNKNYTFIKGSICDKKIVAPLVRKADIIVNGAAETHVDRSINGAEDFVNTNVYGTYVLLESCSQAGGKRFVQISTDEVYGSIDAGSFTEESPLMPNSSYAATKASGDMLVRSFVATHDLDAVITRSSNNYGPYQHPEKMIPRFITNLLQGKKIPLYGDGNNVRDWLFVDDNCRGIAAVMERGKPGEIYNISGREERKNIDVAKALLTLMGCKEGRIEFVSDRKGHDRRYSMCNDKTAALGWQPIVKFPEGLKSTVEWYRKNHAWWEAVKE